MRLGVVIPLANEEQTVDELLDRVLAQLRPDDSIFCIVDRASRDRTLTLVETKSWKDARVRPIWAPENRCVVDAYFRGYREAMQAGCQWILEMDGGLSHLPEEIPLFLDAMALGYDYVGGCRFFQRDGHTGSAVRWCISRGGSILVNWLLRTRMKDMTGGFQCFNRPAMAEVLKHGVRSRAHFFQTEIKFLLRHCRWKEVPIHYAITSNALGMAPIVEAFRNLWILYRQSRDDARVRHEVEPNSQFSLRDHHNPATDQLGERASPPTQVA